MKITARVKNGPGMHKAEVSTSEASKTIDILPKENGLGSSVNGGELLFLALATCYCNDVYREAEKRGISIDGVAVEVVGEFGAVGEAARNIVYKVEVESDADEKTIRDLLLHTDTVAEIQNTLRSGASVTLELK